MKRKPDPRRSEGARLERKATRAYLRRRFTAALALLASDHALGEATAFDAALKWVLTRQKRYDKRPGGL